MCLSAADKTIQEMSSVTKSVSEDIFSFLEVAIANLAVTFEACYVACRYSPQGHMPRGGGWQEAVRPNKTTSHSCKEDGWEARFQKHPDLKARLENSPVSNFAISQGQAPSLPTLQAGGRDWTRQDGDSHGVRAEQASGLDS